MSVTINRSANTDATDVDMTASQQMTAQTKEIHDVTDARGRVIRLKRPNPINKLRFIRALGEDSANRLYVGTVSPLMYVVSIDGKTAPMPGSEAEISVLFDRLGDDGMEALVQGLVDHFQAVEGADIEMAKK